MNLFGSRRGWGIAAAVGVLLIAAIAYRATHRRAPVIVRNVPKTLPATQSVKKPNATAPAVTRPAFARDYLDVIRSAYPDVSATQPLPASLKLAEAAHFLLNDPVYLSPARRDLWITRADAAPTAAVLAEAMDPKNDLQTHVIREKVLYVHWSLSELRPPFPILVCAASGGEEAVSLAGRHAIGTSRRYRWDEATSWDEKVVVPTDTGVSVLRFEPQVSEQFHELMPHAPANDRALTTPQIAWDGKGMLAWVPAANGRPLGRAVARYVDEKWADLDPAAWPSSVIHLVPLRDGSVLQIIAGEKDAVRLALVPLESSVAIDEKHVRELVQAMSADEEDKREAAFKELTQYGPGVFPLLENLSKGQRPEVQIRLKRLLRGQIQPTLGGMTLMRSEMRLVGRLLDGGAVFYVASGVSLPGSDETPIVRTPAWLSLRPGQAVELLPDALVSELNPGKSRINAVDNDWVVLDPMRGPRLFVGNGFTPLLRKDEKAYSELVGRDARGRWLFRRPAGRDGMSAKTRQTNATQQANAAMQASTAPSISTTQSSQLATLIVDPTLPDPAPRMPAWQFPPAMGVGWDKDNWPVVQRPEGRYALQEDGWKALDKSERMFTRADEIPTTAPGPSTSATSAPTSSSTSPSTSAAQTLLAIGESLGAPLLTDREGTRYFGGADSLTIVTAAGKRADWQLPAIANGKEPVTLVRTETGRLFLFNQPGRVLRIKPTPGEAQPFKVEATFTRGIPAITKPTRIWLDPAGRIIVAEGTRLTILFPRGYVPPRIAAMMLQDDSDVANP